MSYMNKCTFCGSKNVTKKMKTQTYSYKKDDKLKGVEAQVPVYHCSDCNKGFMDDEATRALHNAICKDMGVLTPTEVRCLRIESGMTYTDLAGIFGVDVVTFMDWEDGRKWPEIRRDKDDQDGKTKDPKSMV